MDPIYDLETDELLKAARYYRFIAWCIEEGWSPYVYEQLWVRTENACYVVRTINYLWSEYFKQLPEEAKQKL